MLPADLAGLDDLAGVVVGEWTAYPMAKPMPTAASMATLMTTRTTVRRRTWIIPGSSSATLERYAGLACQLFVVHAHARIRFDTPRLLTPESRESRLRPALEEATGREIHRH